jgi:hypothetical protein
VRADIWIFLSLAGVVRTRSRLTSASGGGNASRTHESRMNHSTSRKMLAYPLLYLLVFLPVSVRLQAGERPCRVGLDG